MLAHGARKVGAVKEDSKCSGSVLELAVLDEKKTPVLSLD